MARPSVKKAVNSHKYISTCNGPLTGDTAAFDCLKHGAYYNTEVFLRSYDDYTGKSDLRKGYLNRK